MPDKDQAATGSSSSEPSSSKPSGDKATGTGLPSQSSEAVAAAFKGQLKDELSWEGLPHSGSYFA